MRFELYGSSRGQATGFLSREGPRYPFVRGFVLDVGLEMNTMLCWIDWLKAAQVLATAVIGFGTLAIGGIALTIQRQQANTNRLQYRLALFERRMKVFDSTMDLIAVVLRDAKVELPRAFQFLRETRDRELLFGPEIKDYLDEVYRKSVDLHTIDAVSRPEDIPKRTELLDWFSGQSAVATRKFLKYPNFRES